MSMPLTICRNCRFSSQGNGFWRCEHPSVRRIRCIDRVTGEDAFEAYPPSNGSLCRAPSASPYPDCHEINKDGQCRLYEPAVTR